jgi:hypothetical protein
MQAQLDLFTEPRIISKKRYYKDLNIHERINVKANSLGFARVFILQLRRGFDHCSVITRYEHPEGIQWKKVEQQNKLNTSIETIIWREKCIKEKGILNFK